MRNPKACEKCKEGDCADCLASPENSTPVRLYTPKGAARAMLAGKILRDLNESIFFWNEEAGGFRYKKSIKNSTADPTDPLLPVINFYGLYEETT